MYVGDSLFTGHVTQANFYSASALLAMQNAVIATPDLSIRPFVRLSVTFRCFVQTNEDTIVRSSVLSS